MADAGLVICTGSNEPSLPTYRCKGGGGGGGGGGYISCYVGLDPASTVYQKKKKNQEFQTYSEKYLKF